jgi:hypothetical protein
MINTNTKILLSVDWDFFFPEPDPSTDTKQWLLYDWGHNEQNPILRSEQLWETRAISFMADGLQLPMTSGEENTFWQRFKFAHNAHITIAESHCKIPMNRVKEIWNFDAHHDAYTGISEIINKKVYDCENWATVAVVKNGIVVKTVYPKWKAWMLKDKPETLMQTMVDDATLQLPVFDEVFLCKSGSWTPTWIEDKFWKFANAFPHRFPNQVVRISPLEERKYSQDNVDKLSKIIAQAITQEKQVEDAKDILAEMKKATGREEINNTGDVNNE